MKTKIYLLIILFTLNLINIHSTDLSVIEFNIRAFDSSKNDPSNSIYYADKSIDENLEFKLWDEYVFSLYIKSLSYRILGEDKLSFETINQANDYLVSNNLIFDNRNFYVFYGETLLKFKEYKKLLELLSKEKIISILDNESLIEFNILKFKTELLLNKSIDLEKLDKTLTLSQNLEIPELISKVYVLYGDFYIDSSIQKSQSYYLKAVEVGDTYYSALALFKLGKLLDNINYIREAYITSEFVGDYGLIYEILTDLALRYKRRSDYKNLSLTLESINYITEKNSNFLLIQSKKIEKFGYEKEKLALELEKSNSNQSLMFLIIVSMGVAILFLIIMLSIQSYRLRGYNL